MNRFITLGLVLFLNISFVKAQLVQLPSGNDKVVQYAYVFNEWKINNCNWIRSDSLNDDGTVTHYYKYYADSGALLYWHSLQNVKSSDIWVYHECVQGTTYTYDSIFTNSDAQISRIEKYTIMGDTALESIEKYYYDFHGGLEAVVESGMDDSLLYKEQYFNNNEKQAYDYYNYDTELPTFKSVTITNSKYKEDIAYIDSLNIYFHAEIIRIQMNNGIPFKSSVSYYSKGKLKEKANIRFKKSDQTILVFWNEKYSNRAYTYEITIEGSLADITKYELKEKQLIKVAKTTLTAENLTLLPMILTYVYNINMIGKDNNTRVKKYKLIF